MKKFNGVSYDFTGKVAVVTGGSSGIFQAVARGYGEAGARVAILVNRNMKGAEETKQSIEAMGGSARVYKCDVSSVPMIVETVAGIIRDFGNRNEAFDKIVDQFNGKSVAPDRNDDGIEDIAEMPLDQDHFLPVE